jgi:hypothetical protein
MGFIHCGIDFYFLRWGFLLLLGAEGFLVATGVKPSPYITFAPDVGWVHGVAFGSSGDDPIFFFIAAKAIFNVF